MNLYNFENDIDNMIVARGYDYFENDYIASVKLNEGNVYEAQVEGTDLYNIRVELDHEYEIIETQCDCPYDMGDARSVNYLGEKINLIRYHMIKEHDGQKKAQEFIEQNLQYSNFRKMAIEMALKNKEYDSVIKLTLDGEKKDTSWAGLINQ
ncbi:SWIM zinc finger family protein [Paenibacillus glacialis]|uniref:Uncharacterized protein n=1 Tax=Paenibacillus glacialis TaxID=494026 RepID=A0A168F6R0_9BACL|nr:hypothetical protein [Paenibacillus glacialis]OAB35915.1 hypothetical protein PGLA_21005 [Paenibacillus glacialis]